MSELATAPGMQQLPALGLSASRDVTQDLNRPSAQLHCPDNAHADCSACLRRDGSSRIRACSTALLLLAATVNLMD